MCIAVNMETEERRRLPAHLEVARHRPEHRSRMEALQPRELREWARQVVREVQLGARPHFDLL